MKRLIVHEILNHTVENHPDNEVVSGSFRFTYREMYDRILRLANRLEKLGIGHGTVVGVLDVNTHRYLELHYALSMLGAVIHTINFRLPAQDLLYTVGHARDGWIFLSDTFKGLAPHLRKVTEHMVWMVDDRNLLENETEILSPQDLWYEHLVEEGERRLPAAADQVTENDPYSIFYTTGTTGKPKGLRYRQRDIVLAPIQILHHLALHHGGANISSRDVFMPLILFFHIHAWGTAIYVPYLGAKLVLPGKSGPSEQLLLIQKEGVTWCNMVPTQLTMLLDPLQPEQPLPIKVLTGGSPLSKGLARRAIEHGVKYSLIYGGSDQLGTSISVIPEDLSPSSEDAYEILASRTRPLPMVGITVVDREGETVPSDGKTIGEVWVESPWLPEGYFGDEEQTKHFYKDGKFRTGDLAVRYPDGTLYVVDRVKEAVKSGGEWIPTGILESILSEHPAVKQAVVLARPDEKWGERPVAILVASHPVTQEEMQLYLKREVEEGKISPYWVPDEYLFVEELPTTSAGKIHKVALRQKLGLIPEQR